MYDLSISQDKMYEAVERVRERMNAVSEDVVTIGFGHFGDGNLHLLVSDAREEDDEVGLPYVHCTATTHMCHIT
jgi:FAD/FMN-containing dehydrogenase